MALQVHFAILHCNETEDSGTDECVLKWNGYEFWRGEMKGGRDRDTEGFVLFPNADQAIVSLTELDSPDEDDHLGAHTIRRQELGRVAPSALPVRRGGLPLGLRSLPGVTPASALACN
jgi:hypothetical protein